MGLAAEGVGRAYQGAGVFFENVQIYFFFSKATFFFLERGVPSKYLPRGFCFDVHNDTIIFLMFFSGFLHPLPHSSYCLLGGGGYKIHEQKGKKIRVEYAD